MPITPHLSRQLRQALGDKAAEELVSWIHDQDAEHTASRDTVRADIAEFRQEMRAGFGRADARLAEVREEMRLGFARADEQRAQLQVRFERRFGDLLKWSFVFWVGAVGAVAMLAGVLG